jgi:hypothetical protein
MLELDFIADAVEEQIIRGNLRWLANFTEIHRNYALGEIVFPIYASGSLQERGFFLSRIFSALVTPKYKVHFFLYKSPIVDSKIVRKMLLSLKSRFSEDDWVFLSLVQSQSFTRDVKDAITGIKDKNIGLVAFSLASKESVCSQNVLGKGLLKQLKLIEAKFEAFDLPSYLKSFTIVLSSGVLFLAFLALSGLAQAIQPLTLLLLIVFSLIIGHKIYRARYHTTLTLSSSEFKIQEGQKLTVGKWSDYSNVTIYITPKHETCLRLYSDKGKVDLPISRVGLSRREAYEIISSLVKGRK